MENLLSRCQHEMAMSKRQTGGRTNGHTDRRTEGPTGGRTEGTDRLNPKTEVVKIQNGDRSAFKYCCKTRHLLEGYI